MCDFSERGGDRRFTQRLEQIAELHSRKQHDYGAAEDPFANIRASQEFGIPPWVGAVVRLNDKVTRIKSFIAKGELKNEPIRDAFFDIAVYALIADILFEEKVREEIVDRDVANCRALAAVLTPEEQDETVRKIAQEHQL